MDNVKIYEVPDEATHEGGHGGSFKLYWGIALLLLIATVIEVFLSEWEVFRAFTGPAGFAGAMMGIALIKAAFVVLFYMHLKYEKPILWLIFAIPFALVSLLAITLFAQP